MNLSDDNIKPIGGYLELELPRAKALPFKDILGFQSARSAFLALLRSGQPKRVWMPRYICNAMVVALEIANVECVWYDIDEQLFIENDLDIDIDDWFLYVNYFGICNSNIEKLMKCISPEQIVLDYAQAFFSSKVDDVLATIYSPRKFFGVPDGGLLLSRIFVPSPELQDTDSLMRTSHLLKRLSSFPEEGYADYQRSENSLVDSEPKKVSKLTERILSSIDFDEVKNIRQQNFMFLHEKLGQHNSLKMDVAEITGPLCYPFLTHDSDLRNKLIVDRIFIPTYWEDAIGRAGKVWSGRTIRNLLPLPIDQRYDQNDMDRIVSIVLSEKV